MRRNHVFPFIGEWYWDIEHTEHQFEIVAIDNENKSIEIQYLSGDIEELSFDDWFSMQIAPIAPPKDRFAPFDIEKEIENDEYTEMGDDLIHPTPDKNNLFNKFR